MMNEKALRDDIIAAFKLIIMNFCRGCTIINCQRCLYIHAASNGHLKTLQQWAKEGRSPETSQIKGASH